MSPEELARRSALHALVMQAAQTITMLERNHGIPPTDSAGALAAVAWTTLASYLGDRVAREVFDAIASDNRQPTFKLDLNVIEGVRVMDRH